MATIFARRYDYFFWDPEEWSGPCPHLSLREWEVDVILSSLPRAARQALRDWLNAPTDERWFQQSPSASQQPETLARQRAPFAQDDLRQPVETLCALYWEEVRAARQTLDASIEALHGITRNALLAAHGARLRQLTGALGEPRALDELARMTRPLPPRPLSAELLEMLSERWGGRWAAFFAGTQRPAEAANGA